MDVSAAPDGTSQDKRYPLLYCSFVFFGTVFLVPYNGFISAADYLLYTFPTHDTEALFPAINVVGALVTTACGIALVKYKDVFWRMKVGSVAFIISMLVVILIVALTTGRGTETAYAGLMLVNIGIAVAAGVQQIGFYGLAAVLPSLEYTEAVMTGESIAASIVVTMRIITKFIGYQGSDHGKSLRTSTLVYFCLTLGILLFSFVVQYYVKRHPLVRLSYKPQLKHAPPEHEPGNGTPDAVEENVSGTLGTTTTVRDNSGQDVPRTSQSTGLWLRVKDGLRKRWRIMKAMWTWFLSMFLNMFITLLLFPGILTKVPQVTCWGDWTPIILIAIFSYTELVGKLIGPDLSAFVSGTRLLVMSGARFILLPLLILCIVPFESPALDPGNSEVAFFVAMFLGFTSGVFTTIAMSRGPKDVPKKDQELAGMLMVLAVLVGLSLGGWIAVAPSNALSHNTTSSGM